MTQLRLTGDALWERIEIAVDTVRERLRRVSSALDGAGVRYAVIGGNAVQIWVAQVDESVVRNTRDVDILIDRTDLEVATRALVAVGFRYRETAGVAMFLDGPTAGARDAVHVIFAGEKVRADYSEAAPGLADRERVKDLSTLPLEALVRMKLTSYRRKDQVHILDMLSVGLLDESWVARFSPELQVRLQELIDDPEG